MDTRAIGRVLEQQIVNKFLELGVKASLSKNSGCGSYNLGDINVEDWVIEAKKRNTKDITIKADVWNKLVESVPLHSKRNPMYVIQNKDGITLCAVDIDMMFKLIKGWRENNDTI